MNKKLMAVAVAGAIGAPGLAFAQAANVNIYGVMDARWDSMKFTGNTAGTINALTKNHFQHQASRWGLRGSEDLGGGLSAFFQLESGLAPDGRPQIQSDTGGIYALGGRDSWIGIRSNSWGEIKGGGFGTAYKAVAGVWHANAGINHGGIIMGNGDSTGAMPSPNCSGGISSTGTVPVTSGTVAGGNASVCLPQVEGGATAFSRRESNYVEYTSPTFSGFQVKIGTAASEMAEPTSTTTALGAGAVQHKPKLWSSAATWSGGPFSAAVAYETHTGFRASNAAGTGLAQRMAKDTGTTVGGKWNFGVGQVGLGWERQKYANTAAAGAENNFSRTAWVLNGDWRLNATMTLSAGYSKTAGLKGCGAGLSSTAAVPTCGGGMGANHKSLGFDMAMSKRTSLYAIYSKITNNAGASYYYIAGPTSNNTNGASGGLSAGSDVTLMGFGAKHTF